MNAALSVAPAPPTRIRRAAPLVAGLITVVALSSLTDAVMHATGVFPPSDVRMADAKFVLPLAYRFVFAVLGCHVAARLSLGRPMRDAMRLAVIGFMLGMLGVVATWNSDLGPRWYALAVALTALPAGWLGGHSFSAVISSRVSDHS